MVRAKRVRSMGPIFVFPFLVLLLSLFLSDMAVFCVFILAGLVCLMVENELLYAFECRCYHWSRFLR